MKHLFATSSALFLLSALSTAVQAQYVAAGITQNEGEVINPIYTAPIAGIPIRFDNGVFVYAAAQVGMGYNSNVRASEDNARSSGTLGLRPFVVGELKQGGDRYTLAYEGNYTDYTRDDDFNYAHHDITLAADKYFTARSRMALALGFADRTDDPGVTNNPQSNTVDRWKSHNLRGIYAYGAEGARGRIEIEGSMAAKRYQNNLANTEGSDLDSNAISGRFYWRVMPNTYATAELRRIDSDYRLSSSTNDNVDNRALVGVTWDITRITSGSLRVGEQRKDYRDRDDVKTGTYEAELNWSPRTYSKFTAKALRAEEDATDVGTSLTNTRYSLDWAHRWTESLSTNVVLANGDISYRNSGGRQDDTTSATLGLKYEVSSNLGVSLDITRTERDSNAAGFDFKRNTVFAAVQVAL